MSEKCNDKTLEFWRLSEKDLLATEDFVIVKRLKHSAEFFSKPENCAQLRNILLFYQELKNCWKVEASPAEFDKALGETLKYAGDAFVEIYKYTSEHNSISSNCGNTFLDDAQLAYYLYGAISFARYETFPEDTDVIRNFALSLQRQAQLYLLTPAAEENKDDLVRRYENAIPVLTRVLTLFEKVLQITPDNLKSKRNVSVACLQLGDAYDNTNQPQAARSYFDRCRAIRQELYAALPDNPEAQKHWREILARY